MPSLILFVTQRWLFPILLLVSAWLCLRGHVAPGGGFIGALVAAAAFMLHAEAQYHLQKAAFGFVPMSLHLPYAPVKLIGFGLLLSVLSGLPALFGDDPFLTGLWLSLPLPDGQMFKLGTPMVFDLGVYFAVLGALLAVAVPLFEEAS